MCLAFSRVGQCCESVTRSNFNINQRVDIEIRQFVYIEFVDIEIRCQSLKNGCTLIKQLHIQFISQFILTREQGIRLRSAK